MELEALEDTRSSSAPSYPDQRGYKVVEAGINLLAIYKTDPVVNKLQIPEMTSQPSAA